MKSDYKLKLQTVYKEWDFVRNHMQHKSNEKSSVVITLTDTVVTSCGYI